MQPIKIIKYALDSTIQLINKGEKASAALEKVAREMDLNPNYIQRTGEALNVALHYDHIKKAADKSTDFDVADIPGVTKTIFGDKEKTLAQKQAEWFPKVTENIDYNKFLTNPLFKKAQAEIKATDAKNEGYDITFKGQYKKAADYINRLDRELDELKTEKVATDIHVESSFFDLVNGFKKEASARIPFHEFESQVYATYGERSVPYLDLIYKSAAITEARGAHDDKYINFSPARETKVFGSMLKAAQDKITKKAELAEAESYVNSQKQEFRTSGYRLNPLAQAFEKAACEDLAVELDAAVEVIEKQAGDSPIGRSAIVDLISKFHDTMTGKDAVKPVFPNSKVDDRERVAILQELIMTDPILVKQDPRKIIQAYQQLIRLAPHISKEKEVVRAKLREMMAGQALHPTDANQLVEANTNIMKQHQMLHQTDGGGKDKGKK